MPISNVKCNKAKILLLAASLMLPALGLSQPHREKGLHDWLTLAEQTLISREQAISIAKRRQTGKVLSAELSKKKPPVYKVKMVTNKGRVKTLNINAVRKRRAKN